MSYEIDLIIKREQRKLLRQKIIAWEDANGILLTPMKRDFTKSRYEQLVDDAKYSDILTRKNNE